MFRAPCSFALTILSRLIFHDFTLHKLCSSHAQLPMVPLQIINEKDSRVQQELWRHTVEVPKPVLPWTWWHWGSYITSLSLNFLICETSNDRTRVYPEATHIMSLEQRTLVPIVIFPWLTMIQSLYPWGPHSPCSKLLFTCHVGNQWSELIIFLGSWSTWVVLILLWFEW